MRSADPTNPCRLRYQKVAIIHGYCGSGATHWQRWLERKCRSLGADTVFPKMPERFGEPKLGAWLMAWRRSMPIINETTALIGHSLGCATILQRLARDNNISEAGLVVLVAPTSVSRIEKSDAYAREAVRKAILGFYDGSGLSAPFHHIAANKVRRAVVITSDDDPWVEPREAFKMALEIGADFHLIHGGAHLSVPAGFHRFPEVLELLAVQ